VLLMTANIFQPLIDVFQSVLVFFHDSLGLQWGWAIVTLTMVIRALMIPLTVKQFHSMQALQRHQPELKAIQAKYKDDKQRQQQELMKFYKENNVNPLGSCLPLALQLPVFISLFYMLRTDLRVDICKAVQPHHLVGGVSKVVGTGATVPCGPHNGAGFLFISDLTNSATGITLILLLLLYVGSQLASSLVMQAPTMDKTQRRIMLFMPLIFVFIVIRFPAGVLVYWITTNCWTIAQQLIVKRRIGSPSTVAVATAGGGSGGSAAGAVASPAPNGSSGGGLAAIGSLLRGAGKGEGNKDHAGRVDADKTDAGTADGVRGNRGKQDKAPTGTQTRDRPRATPPPSPRKKKKRSGRRR
jgi:YidC/Oxa1 family membrane protein insertase